MSGDIDRVAIAAAAAIDLEDLVGYIADRNPVAGERIRASILAEFTRLARLVPRLDGREVTLRSGEVCRRSFVHPAVIFYRRTPGVLEVVRVLHHAREPIAR